MQWRPGASSYTACARGIRDRRALAAIAGLWIAASQIGCEGRPECGILCDSSISSARNGDAGPRPGRGAHLVEADAACAMQSVHAEPGPASPVDVIFVIDNSGSMSDEIAQVRQNINQQFAALVADGGVDYKVIVISHYGSAGTDVCIEPPLAGARCGSGLAASDSPIFFHYDKEIGSNDALCQMLATFNHPDASGRAEHGWQAALRPDAQKAFIVITDDSAHCSYREGETYVEIGTAGSDPYEDALTFHKALLARSPEQFGVPPDLKYQFFSIVGIAQKEPATDPIFPFEPIQYQMCDTAPTAGLSYQALSIITDALRYPVCEGRSFDAIFRVLARSVIQASKTDCIFELPTPPAGQTIDRPSINLEYHVGGEGGPIRGFSQVAGAGDCKDDHSFYIRDRIELCPAACRVLQDDSQARVDILFGCLVIPD